MYNNETGNIINIIVGEEYKEDTEKFKREKRNKPVYPNCYNCKHFTLRLEDKFPYKCHFWKFQSAQRGKLLSVVVYEATGIKCIAFSPS